MSNEWLVTAALGTLICGGLLVLGMLARHGFGRITSDLADHGQELKAIRRAVDTCVTREELGQEVAPLKEDLKRHERRLTVIETRCDEHHRVGN